MCDLNKFRTFVSGLTCTPFEWEKTGDFHPDNIQLRDKTPRYVNINGKQVQNPSAFPFNSVNDVTLKELLERDFTFLDSDYFIAGNVHNNASLWRQIISDPTGEAMDWIVNQVHINKFMTHFKGDFQGVSYDHSYPPARCFRNAPNCKGFVEFINSELTARLKSGAISYVGKVGEVNPPHVVSPITIEPSKPRLCINLMYVNCFMRETPFTLDTLVDIPRVIRKGSCMTKLDDLSGYNNVFMSNSSRTLLGFQWAGHYFVCNTIPFGWRNSAYVYNNLNLQAVSFLRKQSITSLLYIDDRLLEEYNGKVEPSMDDSCTRSRIAIHWAVLLLVGLGYFLNISKSVLSPTPVLTFLGMIVDSIQCSFFITEKRRNKIKNTRDFLLRHSTASLLSIQKFAGLCISMVLAIPAAKLYTAACNKAISLAIRNKSTVVSINGDLREEIEYWKFLDEWNTPFPWLSERHSTLRLSTDSSDYKWGAVYHSGDCDLVFSDYWLENQKTMPIMVKEALALKFALCSLRSLITAKRIKAFIDFKPVIFAWLNQGSHNADLNRILKDIFQITLSSNCLLELEYVNTSLNPSDAASRSLSKSDATISLRTWLYIQYLFGEHFLDMFSLDSNGMKNSQGEQLQHFTPFPTPKTSGVDAFAQKYDDKKKYLAFPPICLLPALVNFIIQEAIHVTLVFPVPDTLQPWHVLIMKYATLIYPVGYKHDKGVLLYPSKRGYLRDKYGLPWDLMAAHFHFPMNMRLSSVSNMRFRIDVQKIICQSYL